MSDLVTPEDGMVVTRDTTFAPGVYWLPNGIEVAANHVTLDGNGAVLVGSDFAGRGVRLNQRIGVTLKNLHVERYYHAIWANASANVTLAHNRVTRTHELPGPDVFLDVWLARNEAYGAGIFMSGVIDSFVLDNDAQHQQNGVMLYGCENVHVARNNASFNSGYGLMLYESSRNLVEDNVADFCCRIYHYNASGQPYHIGGDAASLVMMCNSSHNVVRRNKLRGSGDGVFLGGFHRDLFKVPCNDNVFEKNDGSYSPNIAFEATFSQRNVFRDNVADNGNYGFWLGYSSETTVSGNSIRGNRTAGVAIEQGHHNTIEGNDFERNRDGAQFWVGATPAFTDYFPDCADSHETFVRGNNFVRNDCAVRVWTEKGAKPAQRCHHFAITDNTITDNRTAMELQRVRDSGVQGNRIFDNVETGVRMIGCRGVAAGGNAFTRT